MHWKHQLRSRARKLKAHAQATGGGPPIKGITEFEEQAITTFGAAAVDRLRGVGALGHQILPQLHLNTEPVPAQAPASSPTVTSLAPTSSPTVTSPAPAFPAFSINFSSSPSPPDLSSSSLSPPILPSPMPSPSYIPSKGILTAAKMLGAVLKKWRTVKSQRRRPLVYKRKL